MDEQRLEDLFNNYFRSLSAFAFGYVNDHELAWEIVQNCFVELWSSRKKLSHADNLKAYLYGMVRNDCVSYLRKKKPTHDISAVSSASFLETNIIKWETIRILYDAIEELSGQSREVINYALDGRKNQEIADIMGISVNTVHTVKKRAYKKLREILKDHYFLLLMLMD